MARPRVFISSTFYDLRHIRSSLEVFIKRLGYEPILSEKGRIPYDPDIPLDESCYREVISSDIFVLIIGGRYGSAVSNENLEGESNFYERYESITKREHDTACSIDIPIYILIERSVFSEYETYRKNKGNNSIEYAHVDSINVFRLIEGIVLRSRNNPIHQFEGYSEIEEWLRDQWAGLFHEYINRRSEIKQIASLSQKIEELSSINISLQHYMESIVTNVSQSPEEAKVLILSEKERMDADKRKREFRNIEIVQNIAKRCESNEQIEEIFRNAKSLDNIANMFARLPNTARTEEIISNLRHNHQFVKDINYARSLLGLPELVFESSEDGIRDNLK